MRRRRFVRVSLALVALATCKPQTPQDKLRSAVRSGKVDRVDKAIEDGGKLEDGFEGGQTALHLLAATRATKTEELARHLIEDLGVDPSAKDDRGRAAWDVVFEGRGKVSSGQAPVLLVVLEHGFVPSKDLLEGGKTLLHQMASRAESSRGIELLVKKHDFDPTARDDNGWTPLHDAVLAQNVPAATALLANGADANAETTTVVGRSHNKGETLTWSWRYEAGSRPLDVMPQTRQRFGGDVREVVREYGGTPNEAVKNVRR